MGDQFSSPSNTTDKNPNTKGVLQAIGAYFTTVIVTILLIALATTIFIDTTSCSAVSKAFPGLLITMLVVFLSSIIFVRILTWRTVPGKEGRLVILIAYGVILLVSFLIFAFGLLLAFNC